MTEDKFCKDCGYSAVDENNCVGRTDTADLLTGEQGKPFQSNERRGISPQYAVSSNHIPCGPEGKHWKAKDNAGKNVSRETPDTCNCCDALE
jgi:hypothetical protein